MEIGAQFYTLHEQCKTLEGLENALKRVAEIGYKNVQISGTCPYEPAWLNEKLKENGLKCVLTHIAADKLKENPEAVVADHNVFGCDYIGLGYYAFHKGDPKEAYETFKSEFMPVADRIKAAGKYFMYHNHDGEFIKYDGKIILKRIAEDFSADKLGVIVDTFWVQAGGGDPAAWIEDLKGRVPCIHLKDYSYGKKMAVVGEGNINFDRVFKSAEAAGTKYMLVEQDDCNGEDPFDCLKRSFNYLKSCGF